MNSGRAMGETGTVGKAGGGVCRVCGVRHFGLCHKCPHAGTLAGAEWEETPCADCRLADGSAVRGHGRGVSLDDAKGGLLARAAEVWDKMRAGIEYDFPEEIRERFVRFLHGLADMGPAQYRAFQSWLAGDSAATEARGEAGVTRQATAKARRKMLARLGLNGEAVKHGN